MSNIMDISNLKITVGHPNGTLATVSHVGNLKLTKNVILYDVLVVPGYCVSLLSMNKMIKDSKLFVGFDEEKCYIQDLKKEIILGTGSESGGLYLFDLQSDKNIGNVNMIHAFNVSKSLWHSRLGHPADQVLYVLKDELKFSKNTDVSACEAAYLCLECDKFTSRSDKCVLLGYSSSKKAYKLFSLDNRNVYASDADHLTFLDNQLTQSPYDEERATSVVEGSPSFSETDTDFTQSLENGTATQFEDNSLSEDSVQFEPRRSSRVSKLPAKLNDYVVDSKLKYGLEKHVSYAKLNVNYYFATTLNKSVEPTSYYEAAKDPKWIEAMNEEIDALYRNYTWTIVDLPKGRKAIGNKWIYKIKYKASGEVERYKARLVAKGFSQKEGFDYDETFSLVVKMVTVRCVITLAISYYWPMYQLDVNNAFLYGDLVEDVYMTLPLGFGNNSNNKVRKLNKSLYGLKQAPRQWNAKLTAALVEHGLFKANLIILCLSRKLEMCLLSSKPAATPLQENTVLNFKENENDKLLKNFMHSHLQSHFKAALRVLRYLKGAPGTRVQFLKNNKLNVKAYSDVDWAKCPVIRKSVSGFVDMIGNYPVSWKSKKQPTISRSLAEAEYRCLAATTCKIIWLCNILGDLKVSMLLPVKIFCDSNSAIQIACNHVFHEKTKHFEIDVHIVREKIASVWRQSSFRFLVIKDKKGEVVG
ncbi:ribonuclease H-like domain-containing protein [Tanacetum coccineum]